MMLSREFVLFLERYIGIPLVGWMIANGWASESDKEVVLQILNHVISAIIMVILYYTAHKKQSPVVSGASEITVVEKTNPVKKFLTFLKGKFIEEKKTEYTASTTDSTE